VQLEEVKMQLDLLKKSGKKIVFTNGCFDLIHKGHISYLEKAKKLGDILVVGLNSDESVKRLKGVNRPIKTLDNRAAVLAGLASVDFVIKFEEDTPKIIIEQLCPDILIKGGDYTIDQIVGADFVLKNGGEVLTIDFVPGFSSSQIIQKMEVKKNEQ
jgi:D-beta-D-heptose 7-phosphate kinase/D-beta-D-heptose 1-phosphate adenosyltransferase